MQKFVDACVEFVGRGQKVAIIRIEFCALVLLPMVVVTNYNKLWQILATVWIILNVVVRSQWPT